MNRLSQRLLRGPITNHSIPQHGKVVAEYVWIDGTGINMRSKCRTLDSKVTDINQIPKWNYDGSSCNQATTENSEVILKPCSYFPDPFRGGDNILVMCSTYKSVGDSVRKLVPTNTNYRHFAEQIFKDSEKHEPWFGIEQEYTLFTELNNFTRRPLGWPDGGYPEKQGEYYCSVGATSCFGREVVDAHYRACLAAQLGISGTNAEVMPGSWEFQVGPTGGIEICDKLWMARYILWRVTEHFDIDLTFHPKPMPGDWNGAGCHTNISTKEMREDGGYEHILDAIRKLEKTHVPHIEVYGEGNDQRLHGHHETCHINTFKYGVGDRTASIRIPTKVKEEGKGFLEDRRPASNMDPYAVCAMLCSTILLNGQGSDELHAHYRSWIEEKKTWDN